MSNIRGKGKDDSIAAGDHIVSVRFNQSETSVLASAGSDKTVCLYDVRSGKATSRLSLNVRLLLVSPVQANAGVVDASKPTLLESHATSYPTHRV